MCHCYLNATWISSLPPRGRYGDTHGTARACHRILALDPTNGP